MLNDICLFDASEIKYDEKKRQYCFPVYNLDTGLLWYTASCSTKLYQMKFGQLEKKPYHFFFITAKLVDVPMLMDIVGPIPEARQRLDLVDCSVLASDVHVP